MYGGSGEFGSAAAATELGILLWPLPLRLFMYSSKDPAAGGDGGGGDDDELPPFTKSAKELAGAAAVCGEDGAPKLLEDDGAPKLLEDDGAPKLLA